MSSLKPASPICNKDDGDEGIGIGEYNPPRVKLEVKKGCEAAQEWVPPLPS